MTSGATRQFSEVRLAFSPQVTRSEGRRLTLAALSRPRSFCGINKSQITKKEVDFVSMEPFSNTMRKTVNTTWYLSLAISDFFFCAFLPFNISNMAMKEWFFGSFMCKFTSAAMFINMFSSIFLLIVISMDRCVSVMFPVWAQNHRSVQKASAVVVFAWLLAIGMSIPSMIFRDVQTTDGNQVCFNNYGQKSTSHKIIAVTRFIVGFVVPFTVIIICYSIIIFKLQNNRMTKSSKPFKVMTALVVTFFVCWLPYHVFVLLELNHHSHDHNTLTTGLQVGALLASANSFLNPLLYVFMGNDFKKKLKSSLLSKMENAMADEGRTTSRYLSRAASTVLISSSMFTRISAVYGSYSSFRSPDRLKFPSFWPSTQSSRSSETFKPRNWTIALRWEKRSLFSSSK
ncbi:hypothetical protein CCH79_00009078 [Gambusia affinis]|uniref:G-protein coupled receptors family 1 profile domain-containing protein n=1 Tax=Gambusia affinis TaxID=33528 RepID=A0A315UWZ3_GAMAF|nr:hypothetical protein CCH79_00009078 [Gambusia affinis]